jgi:hypothetical protein
VITEKEGTESSISFTSSESESDEVPIKSKDAVTNLTMEQDLEALAEFETASPMTKGNSKKCIDGVYMPVIIEKGESISSSLSSQNNS